MWTTNVRIRALAQSCLQLELPIYGFDQKGIYMNEAGSKNVRMLALDGETTVALKDNHAATRNRVSLMTTVVSDQEAVDALEHGLPIEILFRGGTDRIINQLEAPAASNVYGPKWLRRFRSHLYCSGLGHVIASQKNRGARARARHEFMVSTWCLATKLIF